MRPRTQKQPQVKKELCRVLDDVDVVFNNPGSMKEIMNQIILEIIKTNLCHIVS